MPTAVEQTLSIIKPDGVRRNLIGEVLRRFEQGGLVVRAMTLTRLSKADAQAFYAVHRERPFYGSLTEFMCSGPIVVAVLEGYNAIARNRELMGATNPAQAAPGTIRKDLAESLEANTVHGSDSPETAAQEIRFFFAELALLAGQRAG
jgi:nucleoside-diphosphate kinase